MSVTPSLPRRGRQPKGSAPLTPLRNIFANLLSAYRITGDAPATGAEARVCWSPQERSLVKRSNVVNKNSRRIVTYPKKYYFFFAISRNASTRVLIWPASPCE